MASETFVPRVGALPDYGLDENWLGGAVPGLGTVAVIDGATAIVDPEATLTARLVLRDGATLSGNDSGFSLGDGSAVSVEGANALYADGAIVNRGNVVLAAGASLTVVVEAGAAIAQSYGLKVPSLKPPGRSRCSAARCWRWRAPNSAIRARSRLRAASWR